MSWFTLEAAGSSYPQIPWLERIERRAVSSYVDERQRRWVWIEGDPVPQVRERREPADEHDTILALMQRHWSGSDRELERRAGLPKAFLAKAKKGQRQGPRSAPSWVRLESFLRELSRAA